MKSSKAPLALAALAAVGLGLWALLGDPRSRTSATTPATPAAPAAAAPATEPTAAARGASGAAGAAPRPRTQAFAGAPARDRPSAREPEADTRKEPDADTRKQPDADERKELDLVQALGRELSLRPGQQRELEGAMRELQATRRKLMADFAAGRIESGRLAVGLREARREHDARIVAALGGSRAAIVRERMREAHSGRTQPQRPTSR